MISTLATGLGTGLSLIVAIGSQNAFVLRQGLRRSHVLLVVAVCVLSELTLITAGVAGVGALVQAVPTVLTVVRWLGAAFLIAYGVFAARRAIVGGRLEVEAAGTSPRSNVAVTALALTWLNPHVYLDTVLLLGSIASTRGSLGRWWFGAGAGLAGTLWFVALGFGARLLTPLFRRELSWRILDGLIAAVMMALAIRLVVF